MRKHHNGSVETTSHMQHVIQDIKIDDINIFGLEDGLKQGSDDYNDTVTCIKAHQREATVLPENSRSKLPGC